MNHPVLLIGFFSLLILTLKKLSLHPVAGKVFYILPLPFWAYVLPMVFSTIGWLPTTSPAYLFMSRQVLPVCITLLLIGTDLKAVTRMGPTSLMLMIACVSGTILGGLASLIIYQPWLPANAWALTGALTASWTGGSINLVAVKEALAIADADMAPIVIIDAFISYSWMALLMAGTKIQTRWDRWIGAKNPLAEEKRVAQSQKKERHHEILLMLGFAILLSLAMQWLAPSLPMFEGAFNPQTWTILLVTTLTLALSTTPVSHIAKQSAPPLGTFLLYLILTSIGARASLTAIGAAPIFLAFGITWILIHGLCLLVAGFFLKAPLSLIATASQSTVGGAISGPIVAATYNPKLASIGLLMAILSYSLGTYLGLLAASLAKLLGG